jgi:hypothetical protein
MIVDANAIACVDRAGLGRAGESIPNDPILDAEADAQLIGAAERNNSAGPPCNVIPTTTLSRACELKEVG